MTNVVERFLCLIGSLFCLTVLHYLFEFVAFTAFAASHSQGQLTAIVGGTLIDGTGGGPLTDAVIIIEGETIQTISKKGETDLPPEAKIINAEGRFILPGLIDMHVHYADWMPEMFLAYGVTSVVDLAGYDWVYVQKDGIAKGKIPGPRLFASSPILDGRLFWNVPFVLLNDPEEARARAKNAIDQGVDLLKVYTEISAEEARVVVEEGHKAGLPVMGHIGAIDARQAAELGIDGLAHATGIALATIADPAKVAEMREFESIGISVDYPHFLLYHAYMDRQKADDLIRLLVEEGVALEPDLINTSSRFAAQQREAYRKEDTKLVQDPNLQYIPESYRQRALYYEEPLSALTPEEQTLLQQGYKNLQYFLRTFVEAGGRVLAGSDTASFVLPGISLHREMELLVDAGLSPMQAILAATKNNADFLRRTDVGILAVGKKADLILIRDNPLQDIRHTAAIETVMKGGKILDTSYTPDFRNPVPSPPLPWGYFANPPPVIMSLSSQVAIAGAERHTVVLEGENFLDSSTVEVNGTPVVAQPVADSRVYGTTYLPHYSQMKVIIPATLLTKAGTFPLTITNPQPEGGTSPPVHIIVQFP